jgi:uncharacterized cupredoxin-like copper-binding protein
MYMRHAKDPITAVFQRTICLAASFFLTASIGYADAHDNQITAEPVMAETGTDGIQRLDITLDSYSFTPAYIIVQAGKPVELTLKNVATFAPHNFRLEAAADGLDLDKDVAPGETATLSFLPTKPAVYEFYCDKKPAFFPSHRDKGMIGKLEVR